MKKGNVNTFDLIKAVSDTISDMIVKSPLIMTSS